MSARSITAEDLWKLPRVGSPVPSANGAFVIVPVTTYSLETNEGTTRLWHVPTDGGAPRALTTTEASSGQPALGPDRSRLAFVRKPGGEKAAAKSKKGPKFPEAPQLYVMPLDGGEPERLTDLPLGAADPRWFPDGKRVAFLAPLLTGALTAEGTAELIKSREEDPVKAVFTEDRVYRYWDRWLTDGKVHHLFTIDLETKEIVDLIPDSTRWFPLDDPCDAYRISPDGGEIAFTAIASQPPHDPILFGVFTVKVPRGQAGVERPVHITSDHPAHAYRPVYAPDGRHIVYGIQREIDFYADRVRLVAFERATGRHTVLTEAWDHSAAGWTFGASGSALVLSAEAEGRTALFTLDLEKALRDAAAEPPREILRGGTLTDPQVAAGRIFATLHSLGEPPEVVSCGLDGAGLRRLTSFTAPLMGEIELGRVEEMTFTGAEGRSVQMFLVFPPSAPMRKSGTPGPPGTGQLPLVQMLHGGPHAASGDQWHWRWNGQAFAAPGYLVAMVNFHGSTGWGQTFAAAILGRWGDQPYKDVVAATDALIERGLVDPARMAAAGGSYGGYLASWIASQTDRFACIVNHAGVADLQTQWASDITQGRRRAMGGSPWEGIEAMDRNNPLRQARGFRSPMLVIHGEKDYRVPYDQGLEIYNVLKAMRVPARLVVYPDENHWILKARNSVHWYGEVLGWLHRWLRKDRVGDGAGAALGV